MFMGLSGSCSSAIFVVGAVLAGFEDPVLEPELELSELELPPL